MRLKISKSGAGASIGIKGARLTASARGSTYITVGSDGFQYRQSTPGRRGLPSHATGSVAPALPAEPHEGTQETSGADTIPAATVSESIETSSADLVKQLNERARKDNPAIAAWISCVAPFVLAGSTRDSWWCALVIIPFALGCVLQRRHTQRTITRLFYELTDAETANLALLQQTVVHLSQSQQIWSVVQKAATVKQNDHAGAASFIERKPVRAGLLQIPKVITNLPVPGIDMGDSTLFLLPDMILYREGKTFSNVPYEKFSVKQSTIRFIEDKSVPRDAVVVGETWRHVNRSGGPDRRFKKNRRLPIVEYGVLELASPGGLNILLNTSSAQEGAAFAKCMSERLSSDRPRPVAAPLLPSPSEIELRANALKVLGLNESPSAELLSAAYRQMAQMYHPDKVAGLGPDLRALAEQRMREINAAYTLLKE